MNNLQLIGRVLHYVDDHLAEELSYEHLAEVFGYSPFHFHRIFSSVTDMSIAGYIRRRRLTVAHGLLCDTGKTVAEICYSVGFNSIQTFNRAFLKTFGMQPLVAREKQAKITHRTVEEIITGYLKRVAVEGAYSLEPRFVEREEFVLAGFRRHTGEGYHVIGEAWAALKSSLPAVARSNPHTMYGFEDYAEDFTADPLAFWYMAGVEADRDVPLPEGMTRRVVKKATYAVFTVNGNNAAGEIGKAFRYAYFVWLPRSEYRLDEDALCDFEFYDERWDCQHGAAQMDIWIPVKPLAEP